jgi:alkanesulfonate monooxygenase SsuD/methylene tetrahydromethanopterin reductase-like flavin-dependent oxidoreductase (luciferase family)
VLAADRAGLDLVGIQDHPYQRRFLDTFVLIGDLLARTKRIRIFPDVASLPMRPPAMIAKAAASLDIISGGRFELGLGGGAFWQAVEGMGGTVRQKGEGLPALEEALGIIRQALDVGAERRVVRNEGVFYSVMYPAGPAPAHRVEIWIGAMSVGALRLIGRAADGWIPGGGLSRAAEFPRLNAVIDEAATAARRDPRSIRRIANLGALSTDPRESIDSLLTLATDYGIDGFVLWPADGSTQAVDRFASEIVPAVRSALGAQPTSTK